MNDKIEDRQEVLGKLGELAGKKYEDIREYLMDVAKILAEALCEKDQQFSILELVSISGSYRVLNNETTEIGMAGSLDSEIAFERANSERSVVIVNDVEPDTLAFYLGTHTKRRNPKRLAVLPCKYGSQVKYLIIFDRISCEEPFSEEERNLLTQASRIISTGIIRHVRKVHHTEKAA